MECESVIAGCDQAVSLARQALFDILEAAHAVWPEIGLDQYIDDLAQTACPRETANPATLNPRWLERRLATSAQHLAGELKVNFMAWAKYVERLQYVKKKFDVLDVDLF